MITTTDYASNRIIIVNDTNRLLKTPIRCNHLAFLFITDGEAKIEINYMLYRVKAKSLVVLSPLDIVMIKEQSHDYNAQTLLIPVSLYKIPSESINFQFYEKVRAQPVVPLYVKELEFVARIYDSLFLAHEMFSYDGFEEAALGAVKMLLQLVHNYFNKYEGFTGGNSFESRKKTLFRKFVKGLLTSGKKSREVLFYANELGVSSGYLNEVCNEVSNYSAKDIIDLAVSSRLKFELSYTDKSIQEIADEYNFPSQSYLSRYYKRMTGSSPSEFRKERKGE